MNTVLFDLLGAQPSKEAKFHGGGEYIKSVFYALASEYSDACHIEVFYDHGAFLDDWILALIQEKHISSHNVKSVSDLGRVFAAQNGAVRLFTGMPYGYAGIDFPSGVISIGVFHGLRGLEKPYDRYAHMYIKSWVDFKELIRQTVLTRRTRSAIRTYFLGLLGKFDVILTDSWHSAYSIKAAFPEIAKNREINVFYAPTKRLPVSDKALPRNDEASDRYIMMINANRWIKNSYRGIRALDGLYGMGLLKGIKTRVYGSLPDRIARTIRHKDAFELFDYVSTDDLEESYRGCELFFYPTLNEGFGLPPLEAMKYGKTCVISGVCSLPELYGNAAYYCNPYDIMEMQNRILNAVKRKIPEDVILGCVRRIEEKQRSDMVGICRTIAFG